MVLHVKLNILLYEIHCFVWVYMEILVLLGLQHSVFLGVFGFTLKSGVKLNLGKIKSKKESKRLFNRLQ